MHFRRRKGDGNLGKWEVGIWNAEVGMGKWEFGSRKWEWGSGRWEVGSGKLEVGSGTRRRPNRMGLCRGTDAEGGRKVLSAED
jgi:hypothetical protein